MFAASLVIAGTSGSNLEQDSSSTESGRERELVRAARAGDRAAVASLVGSSLPRLTRLLTALVGPGGDVEDLVQETFARALRALPRFRGEARFSSWLREIAVNLVRDRFRRPRPIIHDSEVTERQPQGVGEGPPDTRDRLVRAEKVRSLVAGLDRLPVRVRAAFVLRVCEGMSHEEIGALLDITPATSRVYVAQGRRTLLLRRGPHREENTP
jgi:RNA polymerase sigma-70 factor (ECF subfamily)